jgi:hypothetical protein
MTLKQRLTHAMQNSLFLLPACFFQPPWWVLLLLSHTRAYTVVHGHVSKSQSWQAGAVRAALYLRSSTSLWRRHWREIARYIERETTYTGLQEHRNTSESTEKAIEQQGTQEHCNRPGMQRSAGRPQEQCRAQMEHGLITDGTLIEYEVSRYRTLGALREH